MARLRPWPPTRFRRFEESKPTSTCVCIVQTDAGRAYIKALGNPEGPHALAADWIGTELAAAVDLKTLDRCILPLGPADTIPFAGGGHAEPGPAFCTRAESGRPWSGDTADLQFLENPEDIARLVVFDTWVMNRDRHHPDHRERRPNRDNVFLSEERSPPGRYHLLAIDHSECFREGGEITNRVNRIDRVRDARLFGLFPEFLPFINRRRMQESLDPICMVDSSRIRGILDSVPREWQLAPEARVALSDLLLRRATYLAEQLTTILDSTLETGLLS